MQVTMLLSISDKKIHLHKRGVAENGRLKSSIYFNDNIYYSKKNYPFDFRLLFAAKPQWRISSLRVELHPLHPGADRRGGEPGGTAPQHSK